MTDNKKLYVVEINYQAYVWTEDETEVEEFLSEIVDTERPQVVFYPTSKNVLGWSSHNCVYHNGELDVTIHDVFNQLETENQ